VLRANDPGIDEELGWKELEAAIAERDARLCEH